MRNACVVAWLLLWNQRALLYCFGCSEVRQSIWMVLILFKAECIRLSRGLLLGFASWNSGLVTSHCTRIISLQSSLLP